MATLRHIRRKIQSIRSTQTITSTMKMVSASKLRRAQEDLERTEVYAKKFEDLIKDVVKSMSDIYHPLIEEREEKRNVLVFSIASDRGLCGPFNINVITKMEDFLLKTNGHGEKVSFYVYGRKVRDYLRRRKLPVIKEWVDIRRPDISLAETISKDLMDLYLTKEFDVVYLVYTHFISPVKQSVVFEKLLPLRIEGEKEGMEYLCEPDIKEIISVLIPKYIATKIYYSIVNSSTSEHAARMNAMENATENCGEMIESLTLLYNKTRQESITKEMMDIVGGAEALREA